VEQTYEGTDQRAALFSAQHARDIRLQHVAASSVPNDRATETTILVVLTCSEEKQPCSMIKLFQLELPSDSGGAIPDSKPTSESLVPLALKTKVLVESCVLSVAFSPHLNQFAVGLSDKTVRVHDVRTGRLASFWSGHRKDVVGVSFAGGESSDTLLSAGLDGEVRVWNVSTKEIMPEFRGHKGSITCLAFSPARPDALGIPRSQFLATGSQDKTVRLWRAQTGRMERSLNADGVPVAVSFDGNGEVLRWITDRGHRAEWNTSTQSFRKHKKAVSNEPAPPAPNAAAVPTLVSAGTRDPTVSTHAITDDQALRLRSPTKGPISVFEVRNASASRVYERVRLSQDGTRLIAVHRNNSAFNTRDRLVSAWMLEYDARNAASMQETLPLRAVNLFKDEAVSEIDAPVALSPGSGKWAAVLAQNGKEIWLWCLESAKKSSSPHKLVGYSNVIRFMEFSPDGLLLATASDDNSVRVWSVANDTAPVIVWSAGHPLVLSGANASTIRGDPEERVASLMKQKGGLVSVGYRFRSFFSSEPHL